LGPRELWIVKLWALIGKQCQASPYIADQNVLYGFSCCSIGASASRSVDHHQVDSRYLLVPFICLEAARVYGLHEIGIAGILSIFEPNQGLVVWVCKVNNPDRPVIEWDDKASSTAGNNVDWPKSFKQGRLLNHN